MRRSAENYINSKLPKTRDSFHEENRPPPNEQKANVNSFKQFVSETSTADTANLMLNSLTREIQKKVSKHENLQELSLLKVQKDPKCQLQYLYEISQSISNENEKFREKIVGIDDYLCSQYETQIQKLEAEVREHIKIQQQLKLYIDSLTAREEELEKGGSQEGSIKKLSAEKSALKEQIERTKARIKPILSTKETEPAGNNRKSRVSIDKILKTLENSSSKSQEKSLLAKYIQAKKDLSNLSYINGKENKKPVSSFVGDNKRASRSISMAAYPAPGKVKAGQLYERVVASKPMHVQSYLQAEEGKRVIRSQSIGDYLNNWQATRRK